MRILLVSSFHGFLELFHHIALDKFLSILVLSLYFRLLNWVLVKNILHGIWKFLGVLSFILLLKFSHILSLFSSLKVPLIVKTLWDFGAQNLKSMKPNKSLILMLLLWDKKLWKLILMNMKFLLKILEKFTCWIVPKSTK